MYTLQKVMFLLIKKIFAFSILNSSKQKRLKLKKLRRFLYQKANIQNMIVY